MKKILLCLLFSLYLFSVNLILAQNISTYAGNGGSTFSGNGGPAIAAEFYYPEGVGVDDSGNVFVADNNNAVWKVSASSGIITVVAGTGIGGVSPDGGLATASQILQPLDVAVDDSGNVYFSENGANKIRMVEARTGILTTVAGNGSFGYNGDQIQATAAAISYPFGLVVDSTHDIYFADEDNYRIRKVTHSTGIITTIAGNGTVGFNSDGIQATNAYLNYPSDVALDRAGNVYIADYGNQRIREVTVSTGIISTFAGNGTPGISGDGGLATAAELNYPAGVAFDNSGNLYIADEHNGEIRKVDNLTGIITDAAGNGVLGFWGDGGSATAAELWYNYGVAVDNSGNIFVADAQNNRVREVQGVVTNTANLKICSNIEIYPSPSNGIFTVVCHSERSEESPLIINVYNVLGEQALTETLRFAQGDNLIDLSGQPNGVYFYRVISNNGGLIGEGKLVVER